MFESQAQRYVANFTEQAERRLREGGGATAHFSTVTITPGGMDARQGLGAL